MRVLVVAAVLSIAGPALAQEPAGSIAFEFGLSNSRGELGKRLSGEGAFNITERVAAVVGLGFEFARLFSASLSGITIDASANRVTVGGGVRAYGPPGRARAFAQVMAGYLNVAAKLTVFDLRESVSASGLSISPGAGVDIATGERVALRLAGGFTIDVIEGGTSTSFGGGVGIVFGVGSR